MSTSTQNGGAQRPHLNLRRARRSARPLAWLLAGAFAAGGCGEPAGPIPDAASGIDAAVVEGDHVAAPQDFTATAVPLERIELEWSDGSGGIASFRIQRNVRPHGEPWEGWKLLAALPAGTTAYADEDVTSDSRYRYRIRSCISSDCSSFTESPAILLAPAPDEPAGVAASVVSVSRVDVTWTGAGGEGRFEVGRRDAPAGGTLSAWYSLGTAAGDASVHSDVSVAAGNRYRYRVRGCNAAGCSAWTVSESVDVDELPAAPGVPTTAVSGVGQNLAHLSPATQSSTYGLATPVGYAHLAVDGNTDGVYNNGSVSSTNPENEAWWSVDLGAEFFITSVVVWNRTDCCQERLFPFRLALQDSHNPAPSSANDRWTQDAASDADLSFTVPSAAGRFVKVQLLKEDFLSLAEVQVFGSRVEVTWSDNSTNETRFQVQRRILDGGVWSSWTTVANLPANATVHAEPADVSGDGLQFRVRACNLVGCSAWQTGAPTDL
jgi:hypothetical protein